VLKSFLAAAVAFIAITLCLLRAPGGEATSFFGEQCRADQVVPEQTLLMRGGTEQSFLSAGSAPAGTPRVISGWSIQFDPLLGPLSLRQSLGTYAPLGGARSYRKLGESALETARPGFSSFDARIPFDVGAVLGLYGPEGTAACRTGGSADSFTGTAAVGESRDVQTLAEIGLPLTVTLEPDLDRDGYGDESQDGCPEVAALQIECPAVQPRVRSRVVAKQALLLTVAFNAPARVHVFGQVRWRVRESDGDVRELTAGLSDGGTRKLSDPRTVTFRLPLGRSILRRLARIAASESLRALVTVHTVDLAGHGKDLRLTVPLPGRAAA
jgi:hypothetical protein